MEQNEAPESGDNTTNESAAAKTDPVAELRELIQRQNEQIANLTGKFEMASRPAPKADKTLTSDEYNELLKNKPQEAIEYSLKNIVSREMKPAFDNLTASSQKDRWDTKAETDFPMINTDKEFKTLVKKEITDLLDSGMSKDSPKILYKAAEIVAAKYKTTNPGKGGMSGEAPSTIRAQSNKTEKPRNFEAFAKIFEFDDKRQKKVLDKLNGRNR